jgi:hypothetical protein
MGVADLTGLIDGNLTLCAVSQGLSCTIFLAIGTTNPTIQLTTSAHWKTKRDLTQDCNALDLAGNFAFNISTKSFGRNRHMDALSGNVSRDSKEPPGNPLLTALLTNASRRSFCIKSEHEITLVTRIFSGPYRT